MDVVTSGLIGVLVLLVAGCEGPPPEQAPPPPPMASAEAAPQPASPDLAGAPPPAEAAPAPAPVDQTATMAPIPNPEDMSPQDRAHVYGHRYDQPAAKPAPALAYAASAHHRRRHHHHLWARNTHVWRWTAHAGAAAHHLRHSAPAQMAAQKAGPARSAGPTLRPSQPAPVATAQSQTPAARPAPVTVSERLAQLQGSLRGPVADGSGFVVSDDLAAGKPGSVTLTLPADLYARLRAEAGKAGLAHEARRFDVTATLSGDGYVITPSGPQTLAAPTAEALAAPAPSFAWQVQPQPGAAAGTLKADLAAHLTGAGAAQALPLLSLERPVKPLQPAAQTSGAGQDLFNLHMGEVSLPGLGPVPVSSVLAVLLLILVVVVLVAAARHTAERDRAERRKARAAARAAMLAEEERAAARSEAASHRESELV